MACIKYTFFSKTFFAPLTAVIHIQTAFIKKKKSLRSFFQAELLNHSVFGFFV